MNVYIDGLNVSRFVSLGMERNSRKDENLDTGSFVVAPITRREPFSPGSIIFMDEGQYALTGDSVSLCARGDTKGYRHEIYYSQLSRALEFITIRGTDLRQPSINPHKRGYARRIVGPNANFNSFESDPFSFGAEILDGATITVRVFYSDKNYSYEHTGGTHKAIATLHEVDNWTGSITITDSFSNVIQIQSSSFKKKVGERGKYIEITSLSSNGGSVSVLDINVSVANPKDFLFVDVYIEGNTHRYSYRNAIEETIKAHYCKEGDSQCIRFVESDSFYDLKSPDFSFQQGTSLYSALKEIYDSLGMKLKVRYNEGYLEVYGSRYDAKGNEIDANAVAEGIDMSDGNRNQSAEVTYQNAVTENACYSPAYGTATKAKSKKFGVPSQDSWHVITQEPIHAVKRVMAYATASTSTYTGYDFSDDGFTYNLYVKFPANFPIDVTDYVYEREEQALLPVSAWATEYKNATQGNTITWQKGQKDIYVGSIERTPIGTAHYAMENLIKGATYRMFGDVLRISGATPFDVAFNVKYVPMAGGTFEVSCMDEKLYRGRTAKLNVKQSGSLNDLSRLGDNVFGSVSRSGWGDKSITIGFKSDSDIPHIGDFITDEDGEWEVSSVSKMKIPCGWQCSMSLTKNFNRLAQRTKIDREIRQTDISPKLALDSTNVYKEYLYVSKPLARGGVGVGKGRSVLSSVIFGLRGLDSTPPISGFVIKTIGRNGGEISKAYMPIISYQAGNALCFEGGFDGSMSAGYKTEATSGWVTSYVSKPIIYADDSGEVKEFTAYAVGAKGIIDDYSSVSEAGYDFAITDVECNKHANEVLRFNYEAVLLANDGMVAYPRLLRYALNEYRTECKVVKRPTPFSQFEGRLTGGEGMVYSSSSMDTDTNTATVVLSNSASAGENWCITDGDGYPLLACNDMEEGGFIAFSINIAANRKTSPNVICKVTLENVKSVTFSNGACLTESGYACLPYGEVSWTAAPKEGYSLAETSGSFRTDNSRLHYREFSLSATQTQPSMNVQTPINQGGANQSQGQAIEYGNNIGAQIEIPTITPDPSTGNPKPIIREP